MVGCSALMSTKTDIDMSRRPQDGRLLRKLDRRQLTLYPKYWLDAVVEVSNYRRLGCERVIWQTAFRLLDIGKSKHGGRRAADFCQQKSGSNDLEEEEVLVPSVLCRSPSMSLLPWWFYLNSPGNARLIPFHSIPCDVPPCVAPSPSFTEPPVSRLLLVALVVALANLDTEVAGGSRLTLVV